MLGILFWGWFAFWYLPKLREWSRGTGLKTLSHKVKTVNHKLQTVSHREWTLGYRQQTLSHMRRTLGHRQQMLNQTERTLSHLERTASEGGPYKSGPYNSRPDRTGGVGDRRRRGKRMRRRIRKSGLRSTP